METLEIREALMKGMIPSSATQAGQPYLDVSANFKPTQWGLERYTPLSRVISQATLDGASIGTTLPFPQLFRLYDKTILLASNKLFTVNESTWAVTEQKVKSSADPSGADVDPTAGGIWHLADMGSTWAAFNGVNTIFRTNFHNTLIYTSFPDVYLVNTSLTIATGCSHRGRLVMGGFNSGQTNPVWTTLGSGAVAWSSISGGDAFWTLAGSYVDTTVLDNLKKQNELGFMVMPRGSVYCVKALGKSIVVYTTEAVYALTLSGNPELSFYSLSTLSEVGICNRGAVGGNDSVHLWLDKSGSLMTVTQDLKVTRLEYKNYFDSLTGYNVSISYDSVEGDFYLAFSDGSNFILTRTGLATISDSIRSLCYFNKGTSYSKPECIKTTISPFLDYFQTYTLDMGTRNIKVIHSVEVCGKDVANLQVYVLYKLYSHDTWATTSVEVTGQKGFVYPLVSGSDFKIKVYAPTSNAVRIDSIRVNYYLSGRTNLGALL